MYKMHANHNINQGEIIFVDDQQCWCGALRFNAQGRVHHVELADGEVDSKLHGEIVTQELIRELASNAAWDSGIDEDLLDEGIEVDMLFCNVFPEKKLELDDDIFNAWMKR